MKLVVAWLPTAVWAFLIFYVSSFKTATTSEVVWQDFMAKKIAHLTEYFILAGLLYRSLRLQGFSQAKARFWAFWGAVGYAITDEIHQSFTPGREPHIRDIIFDTIGAFIAITSIWKILPKMPKKLLLLAKKLGVS